MIWGDGNGLGYNWNALFNDPLWRPAFETYSSALVFLPKTNIIPHWYSAQSSIMGAWLADLVAVNGVWAECWYWSEAGWSTIGAPPSVFHNTSCNEFPNAMWAQSFVLGMAQGGTVFAVEGEGCTTANGAADDPKNTINPGECPQGNQPKAVFAAGSLNATVLRCVQGPFSSELAVCVLLCEC